MNQLNKSVESILFVANKPLNTKAIAKYLSSEETAVLNALKEIQEMRKETGIVLLEASGLWQLATNAENSEVVKNFLNAELREKLTDATVETLAIIAYRQPVSRGEIEAIRGVNCQYSIRHLLIRGLIQKSGTKDRQVLYETTLEFLQHLGIPSVNDLPDFEKLVQKIKLPETPHIDENEVSPENEIQNEQATEDDLQEDQALAQN
jgi:segregation and condensation protein B